MSTENIHALIKSAEADLALADALRHAGDLQHLVQIGAGRGYDFTQDELEAHFDQFSSDELSERELNLVTGGASTSYLQYKLERCFVKSWSTSGDAD